MAGSCFYFFQDFFFSFKDFCYLFIFRERGKEGERKGQKHQCVVVSRTPLLGTWPVNLGMCPDWESNQ